MEESKRGSRRRHDVELKSKVLAECGMPGASVAQVAMAHGLNANLVHKWRRQPHQWSTTSGSNFGAARLWST
jgi:transposase